MGCELNPQIPYTEFSVIIKKQKEVSCRFLLCPGQPWGRLRFTWPLTLLPDPAYVCVCLLIV